jgi:hypothetical protein
MTEKKSITITGGDLRDSTFGIGTVTSNRGAGTPTTLADLRTALDVHAEGIIVLAPTESEQAAIRHEIDATRRELTAGKPDAQAVRFRWKAVLAVLGVALSANADVARISRFVIDLFS